MRVLVTGGAGFIGSHLCDFLLAQGAEVVCLDNLLTGATRQHRPHLRPRALPLHQARRHQLHLRGAGRSTTCCTSRARPARSTTSSCRSRPSRSARSAPTRRSGWPRPRGARFLLASTSEVYGDPLVHPQREDYWGNVNPIGPRGRLRRGQALRRGHDDGLPPLPRRRHPHRAHLQHLRPAHAARRRARGPELHQPGAARRAAHRLRRRLPDPLLLLRLRPRRGHLAPDAVRRSTSRSTSATRRR